MLKGNVVGERLGSLLYDKENCIIILQNLHPMEHNYYLLNGFSELVSS